MSGCDPLPDWGEERYANNLHCAPGGAANQSVALARLEESVWLSSTVGVDSLGKLVVDSLASYGVDTSLLTCGGRQALTVSLAGPADRAMVTYEEPAHDYMLPAEAPRTLIAPMSIIERYRDVVSTWREVGTVVVGDVGFDASGAWSQQDLSAMDLCDVFVPNDVEACSYTRVDDAAVAAQRLVDMGADTVIVTCGAQGVLLARPGEIIRLPAVAVERVVDTTGAGDALSAGVAYALGCGLDAVTAARMGMELASECVQRMGGAGATPTLAQMRLSGRWVNR
ncbi:MAG: carbohydrate kinase family protein [Actinomycetaceae bacterium]|nr:carbohydrate kinase family protein [Actinomycetaceae bacterium]